MRDVARLVTLLLGGLLAAYPWTVTAPDQRLVVLTGLAAAGVVVAATLLLDAAVTVAALLLAGQYLGSLALHGSALDPLAGGYAALLLVWVEVADLGVSIPAHTPVDRRFLRTRLVAAGILALAGFAAAELVLGAASLPAERGAAIRSLALGGGAVAVAAPLLLLRRRT